jgi:prolycopene isomerase
MISVPLFFTCGNDRVITIPQGAEKWDVVIIGAGGGGLSAGATLARAGVKPLVLEQYSKAGGYMTAFQRDGFRFEVSLHMMDGLDEGGLTNNLFKELGILDRIKLIKFDPLYRAVFPDITIDVPADVNAYIKLLQQKFPNEAEGIAALFDKFFAIGKDIGELSRLMNAPLYAQILKFPLVPMLQWDLISNLFTTIDDFVRDYIKDPKATAVILQLGNFMGVPPSQSPAVLTAAMLESYHHFGVYHFEGGSQAVSNALADVIRENGGEVRLNTRVKKILVNDGAAFGVETAGGKKIYSDYVISNADGYHTYIDLVGEENLDKDYIEYVKGLKPGVSVLTVYLGCKMDLARTTLKNVGEIFYSPSYNIESGWENIMKMNIDMMDLVVAFMSNTDPTCAPKGKSTIIITAGGNYEWNERWQTAKGREEYERVKKMIADRVIAAVEKMIPGLKKSIEVIEIGTPITMEKYTLNYRGSIIGWAPTPDQSLLNRMKQSGPIENLYLAGAWTFPCGGQSAVLGSGNTAARMILKELR